MAWNLRALRRHGPAQPISEGASQPASSVELTPNARGQLLAIFRRLAAVLQLTVGVAQRAGKLEQHAALGARLAVFRARVEAGDGSGSLATALSEFGAEFKAFVIVDLGFRH